MLCLVALVAIIYNTMDVRIAFSSKKKKNNKKFIHEIVIAGRKKATKQSGLF